MIQRKTPLARSTKPLKRTPIKRSSAWTGARRTGSEIRLKRTALKPAKPKPRARPDERLATWCEAHTAVCTGRAEHRHHRRMRSQGGSDDAASTLDACHACHRWIHDNPALSYANGWLLRTGDEP